MSLHAVLAISGVAVVATVDALVVARVLRAYRTSLRRPHLVIAAGIAASFLAVVGCAIVLAAEGTPALREGPIWDVARALSFVGAALAYGLVALFAASAFGRTRAAVPVGLATLLALVALASAGLALHPAEVATPATTAWSFRVPFVALSLAGSIFGAVRAARLSAAYGTARRAGRTVDPVALGRMRTMAAGFAVMAAGQAPLACFTPGGRFDTPLGLVAVGAIMLGALGFVLACVATWATPKWLRARWEAP